VVVVAGSIAIVMLALLVAILVLRASHTPSEPRDARFVVGDTQWGSCVQDVQFIRCTAAATVTNQGGSHVARYQYLAFMAPVVAAVTLTFPPSTQAHRRPSAVGSRSTTASFRSTAGLFLQPMHRRRSYGPEGRPIRTDPPGF
jgi:hypothetical protein